MKLFTKEQFIIQTNAKFCNRYDYALVQFPVKLTDTIQVIDPEYGQFSVTVGKHLNGKEHPKLGRKRSADAKRMTYEEFIEQANKKHSNLYDYSKVVYEHCDKKVCIIDPIYGEFWQTPYQHLRSHGCPARTANNEWLIHKDHIVPLSIIRQPRVDNKWFEERPLYQFLNSDINLVDIPAKMNNEKSDFVTINGKQIAASTVRNNYEIIAHLVRTLLNVDPAEIIAQDKEFVNQYFGLS